MPSPMADRELGNLAWQLSERGSFQNVWIPGIPKILPGCVVLQSLTKQDRPTLCLKHCFPFRPAVRDGKRVKSRSGSQAVHQVGGGAYQNARDGDLNLCSVFGEQTEQKFERILELPLEQILKLLEAKDGKQRW